MRHLDEIILALDEAPVARGRLLEAIEETIENLELFPRMGRILPSSGGRDLRELFLTDYRLLYRVLGNDDVQISGLFHGRRDIRQALDE